MSNQTDLSSFSCPFCGSEDILANRDEDTYFVHCLECHAAGPTAESHEESLNLWCDRIDEEDISYLKARRHSGVLG